MSKIIYLSIVAIVILLTVAFTGISTNQTLSEENKRLQDTLNSIKHIQQPTLVFHVSEKGEEYQYAQLPNATYTYEQLSRLNNQSFDLILLPEYKENLNWNEEKAWIAANFGGQDGIPIMLDVFGGGDQNTPTPMLSTEQIAEALDIANVKYIRFAEVSSWHIENNLSFPTDYVREVLEFCKSNNLQVFWTEWKNDFPDENVETFTAIKTYIQGYDDIVTVSFSTNSQELEPVDAFLKLGQTFTHWGASIQPWYWHINRNQDLMTCPPSLILEHTLTAKAIGAKIIQFEPYWYFFNYDGSPNDNLKLLLTNLKNSIQ